MKLNTFIHKDLTESALKLRRLGKALSEAPTVAVVAPDVSVVSVPRKTTTKRAEELSLTGDDMDDAIMALTSGQKHIHKKISHHD